MEFKDVMLKRRSVRKFKDTPVTKEQIEYLLHMGMSGPSCRNEQSWELYVVTDPNTLEELRHIGKHEGYVAPLNIVIAGNMNRAMEGDLQSFWIQDASVATENILLACTDLGLGAVWIGVTPKKETTENVKRILQLPQDIIPLSLIEIGVPDEFPEAKDYYDEAKIHWVGASD